MNETTSPRTGDEQTAPPEGPRRLRRSADSKIGGVAAGIAEYFGIDPTIVRLAFVVLVFAGGSGVLAYLVGWLVIPGPADDVAPPPTGRRGADHQVTALLVLLGLVVLVFGGTSLWGLFGWGPSLGILLPLGLIALAVVWLVDRERDTGGPLAVDARPEIGATVRTTTDGGTSPGTAIAPYEIATEPEPRERPKASAVITLYTLAAVLVVLGGAALGDLVGMWNVDLVTGFALATLVIGAALVAAAFLGRAVALVPMGILLVLGTLVAMALDPIVQHGAGVRQYDVDRLVELRSAYRLGAGELHLDLRGLDMDGEHRVIDLEVGMGELRVDVPDDAEVLVVADMGAGQVDAFDQDDSGLGVDVRATRDGSNGRLELRVDVGAGYVRVD